MIELSQVLLSQNLPGAEYVIVQPRPQCPWIKSADFLANWARGNEFHGIYITIPCNILANESFGLQPKLYIKVDQDD